MIWGNLTTEDPATVARPRDLDRANFRHVVSESSTSRTSDL